MSGTETPVLDITGDVCPMTLVRVRMGLDRLDNGDPLEILMNAGEAVASIPRTLQREGHQVCSVVKESGAYRVLVVKG